MKDDRPSSTAKLILKAIVFVAYDPWIGALVPSEIRDQSEAFLEHRLLKSPHYLYLVKKNWFRRLIWFVESMCLPGIFLHYVVRKRFIEEAVRDGIQRGASQVVVFAAGFDTLALRLHSEFPDIQFMELDHPATQSLKYELMHQTSCQENLTLIPIDFAKEKLEDTLVACPVYSPSSETVFVGEGISMYMNQEKIEKALRFMSTTSGKGSRVIFTFMDQSEEGRFGFKGESLLVSIWLKYKNEPFTWGWPKQHLDEFCSARSLSVIELADHKILRNRYLSGNLDEICLAEGECICVATLEPSFNSMGPLA